MKHIRGLVSTTQVLRWIFLAPQTIPRAQCAYPIHNQISLQLRTFNSSCAHFRYRGPSSAAFGSPDMPEQLKDEAIGTQYIRLVNEDGSLDPPERLTNILRSIERPENFVLQLSPKSRTDEPPVCKIVNRALLRDMERASAKAARATKASVKQMELNWAIDNNDLTYRLKQITTFLDKGAKVEITLMRKKHKRPPTVEEVKSVIDKVLQTVKDAGALQTKPMEGEPGKRLTIVVKKNA
ncbi:translation initiation factor IF-3, C-terminal domain-containing protein [Aspergillus pseudoustus]|uniref:Translation initiation factor IF-3, C-terminal domain-containing protein n=1 Tax=Aspergillus pseudoustus TaxID=1810923 RepID=A0ABR4JRH3_9EURO